MEFHAFFPLRSDSTQTLTAAHRTGKLEKARKVCDDMKATPRYYLAAWPPCDVTSFFFFLVKNKWR
jgi:hypothetical protein